MNSMGRIHEEHAGHRGRTAAGQQLTTNQKKKQKKGDCMLRKLEEGTLLAPLVQRRSPASVKRSRNGFATFILRNRVREEEEEEQ